MSEPKIVIEVCKTQSQRMDVLRLRDSVYVQDQGRLSQEIDMSETFDRYDSQAVYLLGYLQEKPIAAIKIIQDGVLGLPSEGQVDISRLRAAGNVVEFGHLITERQYRQNGYGLSMMKAALDFAYNTFKTRYIIGDFFAQSDSKSGYHPLYHQIGFQPISAIYHDNRFVNAPESIVGALDIYECIESVASKKADNNHLKEFFFSDLESRRSVF